MSRTLEQGRRPGRRTLQQLFQRHRPGLRGGILLYYAERHCQEGDRNRVRSILIHPERVQPRTERKYAAHVWRVFQPHLLELLRDAGLPHSPADPQEALVLADYLEEEVLPRRDGAEARLTERAVAFLRNLFAPVPDRLSPAEAGTKQQYTTAKRPGKAPPRARKAGRGQPQLNHP